MIIFYYKKGHANEGKIIGTIGDRVHNEDHLKMWIGDPDEVERLIVQWIPGDKFVTQKVTSQVLTQHGVNENNEPLYLKETVAEEIKIPEYIPDHQQKELLEVLDGHPSEIYKYKIDPDKQVLVKI